jgi:regulatory protein
VNITKLTQSEKDPQKYVAEFEDGQRLTVTVALIADFSLYTGRELDGEEYGALISSAASAASKARALRILGARNMSRRELSDRLARKGDSEERAEETADWLEKIGALNDEEYAVLIVRHYAHRGYGESRVRDELYRRGIPRELWEDALANLPDMEDTVYRAFSARMSGKKPDRTELKKATDALYRRGFSWDDIKTAIEKYNAEIKDFSDDD